MHEIILQVVEVVSVLGYLGIIIMMLLESSFFPFPSEVVIIPAGYLAFQGEMNIYLVVAFGILGSLLGSLLNYYLALYLGKPLLLKYGKYVRFTEEKLDKLNSFFLKHGAISTFVGRLIPGIRQYISFPAGLSKMPILKFSSYTILGAGLWVTILALVGYWVGDNQDLVKQYSKQALIYVLIGIIIIIPIYIFLQKKKEKNT
jgi:membrane protein DedA with SNARE-associated domain